jgi:hypothetical protein
LIPTVAGEGPDGKIKVFALSALITTISILFELCSNVLKKINIIQKIKSLIKYI